MKTTEGYHHEAIQSLHGGCTAVIHRLDRGYSPEVSSSMKTVEGLASQRLYRAYMEIAQR